jgi:FeS assembly SUF system protein
MSSPEPDPLKTKAIEALRTCYDPEIPVNIYDLGLIYDLQVTSESLVQVKMTLTAPNCPVADHLPRQIEGVLRAIPGVNDVRLELVWDPPWDRSRMSEAARLALGFDLEPFDEAPLTRLGP